MTGNSVDCSCSLIWAISLCIYTYIVSIIVGNYLYQSPSAGDIFNAFFLASNLPPEIHTNHVHVHVYYVILLCTFYLPRILHLGPGNNENINVSLQSSDLGKAF